MKITIKESERAVQSQQLNDKGYKIASKEANYSIYIFNDSDGSIKMKSLTFDRFKQHISIFKDDINLERENENKTLQNFLIESWNKLKKKLEDEK